VREEPRQGRGLLVQGESVKDLRLDDLPAGDADQVQPLTGGGDRQIIQRNAGLLLAGAEGEQVRQVGGDAADVLGVRVRRRERHLHRQRTMHGNGQAPVDLLQAAAGGGRGKPGGQRSAGTGRSNRQGVRAAGQRLGVGGVDAGGQLHVRRNPARVESLVAGHRTDALIGQYDLPAAVGDGLPGQGQ